MTTANDVLVQVDDLPPELIAALEADGKSAAAPAVAPIIKPAAKAPEAPKSTPDPVTTHALDTARRESMAMRDEIARMQQRLEETTTAKHTADQFGQYRTAQALQQAVGQRQARLESVDAQLAAFKTSHQQARTALVQAKAAGDVSAEMAATDAMQQATSAISQLETQKITLKDSVDEAAAAYRNAVEDYNKIAAAAPTEPEKKAADPAAPPKPQTPEDWIAQFPKKMASWLHGHKDYVTDRGKHNELMQFMNTWIDDYGPLGLQTPQFVDALNNKFDPKQEVEVETAPSVEVVPAQEPSRPSATAVAAPVSRNAAPAKASGPVNTIRLSAEQAAIAPHLYPELNQQDALRQYAKDLAQATADGRFAPRG